MKALIYKDYILCKKIILFYTLIVSCVSISNISGVFFSVLYGAFMGTYVIAYDKQCKWDTLEKMMPYSLRSKVYSLYIFSAITAVFVVTASVLSRCLSIVILKTEDDVVGIDSMIYLALGSSVLVIVILCIDIPLTYKFGLATARIAKLVLYGGLTTLVAIVMVSVEDDVLNNLASSAERLFFDIIKLPTAVIILGCAVICAGLVIVSARISMTILKKKAD